MVFNKVMNLLDHPLFLSASASFQQQQVHLSDLLFVRYESQLFYSMTNLH
jgi:hypothetical protein